MKVFRVETKVNKGPYGSSDEYQAAKLSYKQDVHPLPTADGILCVLQGHYFGFESLEQLNNWFDIDDRKYLKKHKFRVSCYEVDRRFVTVGGTQLVFFLSKASLIETIDITSF